MAVELRCPDCRAKLRLKDDPEPGTEVECPECNAIFPAPDLDTGEVPDQRSKKKSKKPADGDAPKKEASAEKPSDGVKKKDKTPRKRKAKKKETNSTAMTFIIVGAVLFLALVVSLLVWYFTRTPPAYEMMKYLPEEATDAVGLNIGHMQKYAEFIKTVEPAYKELGFQKAIDASATALGIDKAALPDYMVQGWGKTGGSLVIRTKKPFETADLSKLPGAQEGKADGQTYYSISPIPNLFAGAPLKVFAPTNRLIVFSEYSVPSATFNKMLSGNSGGETLTKRLAVCKSTTRGTFWALGEYDAGNRPQKPKESDNGQGGHFLTLAASASERARGWGFKASLGSRAIRFEYAICYDDSEKASDFYRKMKEDQIVKAQDDSSLDPPKWWKEFAQNQIGNKTAAAELMTNLGAKTSGELYIVSSECETRVLMQVVAGWVSKFTGKR